jgi:predicted cation transporter
MTLEIFAAICFGSAIVHTFLVDQLQGIASKFEPGSVLENLFHLLGEVEIVFGLWAGIFLLWLSFNLEHGAIKYLETQNFTEPAFVFVIMVMSSTRPILFFARRIIEFVSKLIPLSGEQPFFLTTLILGPLLGSFITEPAAMTITAILLLERLYNKSISQKLKYATLGLLFVNISIGGTLTPYAAPPILMVASKWNWDLPFMIANFGIKAIVAITVSTLLIVFRFRKELGALPNEKVETKEKVPAWISILHLIFLIFVVINSHHMSVFILLFLFFIGLTTVTKEYQNELKIKEGLLVAFFLGGLVILGGPQAWWLSPLIGSMDMFGLYFGAIGLTAITDNAALTYLGSQVPNLPQILQYTLVAGGVVGGGLTVIANAPNPVGYGILNSSFGNDGVSPLSLFKSALLPTLIAAACFWPW